MISPFIKQFVKESVKKMSLDKLYDEDMNRLCSEINGKPVDITPAAVNKITEFTYNSPETLSLFPSRSNADEYLKKTEQLIESLNVRNQAVFEVTGNERGIVCGFYGEKEDLRLIETSVLNCFPDSVTDISAVETEKEKADYFIYDFIPEAPFFKSSTTYENLIASPLNILVELFSKLKIKAYYQIVFKPLPGDVHKMVREAVDCEYMALQGDGRPVPSLEAAGSKLEYKSPDFRSYFSVNCRIIVPADQYGAEISSFISNYIYGSKKFITLDKQYYSAGQIKSMYKNRTAHHSGFLLNSHELTAFLHVPFQVLNDKKLRKIFAYTPAGDIPDKTLTYPGGSIGKWACGNIKDIHLPDESNPHCHIMGVPGTGKSVLLSNIVIEKLKRQEATFVLDPHGDLVERILKMVPENNIDDVIILDFGFDDYTPQVTIRANIDLRNPSKFADDMSESMRDITTGSEKFFGPRMAYYFACLYYLYSTVPWIKMPDLKRIISISNKSKNLRSKLRKEVKNPIVLDFLDEIDAMKSSELITPVTTRIGALLLDERSFNFLTLDENKISINDILEKGKLCLVNLAGGRIGRQRSSILSGLIDSLLSNNLLARASTDYIERKVCNLVKDEFYLGPGDIAMQLAGMRKFGLNVIFAHQYYHQIEDRMTKEAMGTANSQIIFRIQANDAEVIAKNFGIPPKELTDLENFECFYKVENEIVKVKTPLPDLPEKDFSDKIKANCLDKYYMKQDSIKENKKKKKTYGKI